MRVLLLHNRYQQPGGEDSVVQSEKLLLEAHGHQTALFEVHNDAIVGPLGALKSGLGSIYALGSKKGVAEKIRQFEPDVVHVNNFFPLLSPSIYDACRSLGVPAIQTLHNYRLGCPNAQCFRDGAPCEECLGTTFCTPGIRHGCYRHSRPQTAAVAAMLAAHKLLGTWQKKISVFVALTRFQAEKMAKAGLPAHRIVIKPNFLPDPGPLPVPQAGSFGLFVGRLSPEKGIHFLLESHSQHRLKIPLKVVGDGPLAKELKEKHHNNRWISFLGHQDKKTIFKLMEDARFLVLPSLWYEGFPLTLVEAFSRGLPVLASLVGSMPEIVNPNNGWLVPAQNSAAWAAQMQETWEELEDDLSKKVGARQAYESHYTPEINYQKLLTIYQNAIGERR